MIGWLDAAVLTAVVALALGAAWWRARRDAAALRARLVTAGRELEYLQGAFTRFAPPSVVDRIASRGSALGAERREVTILFADLVGFTRLGESVEPEMLVRVLSDHFRRMSRIVSDHRGHVAKFIGDGMMALFGALEPNPWQSDDAAHAALAMIAAVEEDNRARATAGLPRLELAIGIDRGSVVAGVVGSAELQEFTVIGAAVNRASRMERLTREHGVAILLTSDVREHLDPRFALDPLPPMPVRGLAEPVVAFGLRGFSEKPAHVAGSLVR